MIKLMLFGICLQTLVFLLFFITISRRKEQYQPCIQRLLNAGDILSTLYTVLTITSLDLPNTSIIARILQVKKLQLREV